MPTSLKRLSRAQFTHVVKNGRVFHTPFFSLKIKPVTGEEMSRFSFVISKKVAQSAVSRNKLRRQGYAVLTSLAPLFHKNYEGIVYVKKSVRTLSFQKLGGELKKALQQARIIT